MQGKGGYNKVTGLEKIIKEIEKDAEDKAGKILAEANNEASEILDNAKKEAAEKAAAISANAKIAEADILERGKSADELNIKKKILLKKQEIINDIIKTAEDQLNALSEGAYFDLLFTMVKKFSTGDEGTVIFSENDKNRMPENFKKKLSSECKNLKISDETAKIDSGFILSYGGIEENCSFKALFESNIELLQDKVHTLLFE